MQIRIRPAALADLVAVIEIVQAAYTPYVSRIGREPAPMLDNYEVLISDGRVTVAERDDVVLGLVVLVPQPDALRLDNVAVAPDAQGGGVGKRLLRFADDAAIAAGYDFIKLYTNVAMVENIALYTRIGYVETHRANDSDLNRIYMRKDLRGSAT